MWARIRQAASAIFKIALALTLVAVFLTRSAVPPSDATERVRFYTRDQEFDYLAWVIDAFWIKF